MKHLNRTILEDYDIAVNAPARVRAVQFGDDPILLGLVDRLIDDANARGLDLGLAVVQPGSEGHAKALREQDGLFTVFVRGDLDEKPVHREQVVQSVLRALDPSADDDTLLSLARDPDIRFAILHQDETGEYHARDAVCAALAARFLAERWRAKLEPMALIVCGEDAACAEELRRTLLAFAREWRAGEAFESWLSSCRFFPALADCLVFRSSAEEAARLCAQMNYADAMIHLAEPYGLWAIQADAAFCEEFPLKLSGQIRFVEDLEPLLLNKTRIFDAGLFALAALGILHGNETLADCMKDEPLRDLAGHALLDEILPYAPRGREELIPAVIASYERYANPMNDNRLTDAARGLIHKFNRGVLPALRAYAEDRFEAPKHLSVALAATVMLFADVRKKDGAYETVVGDHTLTLHESAQVLDAFSRLSSDMSPDSLAYAALSDRTLWDGEDLRKIDGLLDAVTENLSN